MGNKKPLNFMNVKGGQGGAVSTHDNTPPYYLYSYGAIDLSCKKVNLI